ncbi:MAG: hypothetical protein Q8N09_09930 [Thermodesulfovibrionia bacterium]|nr:hypothetical protein [Thermodesulfovibrionia bacterium]
MSYKLKAKELDARLKTSGMTFIWSSFPQSVSGNPEWKWRGQGFTVLDGVLLVNQLKALRC